MKIGAMIRLSPTNWWRDAGLTELRHLLQEFPQLVAVVTIRYVRYPQSADLGMINQRGHSARSITIRNI